MDKGEIWVVEFPKLDGHEQAGTRPAVVLAEVFGIAVIVPLTTNLAALRFEHTISIKSAKTNGLSAESVALIFQVRAIDKKRLSRKIGNLEESYVKKIDEQLRKLLKL